jgi:hypothetical protein
MFESPVALFAKPLQCFEDYATQFEKDFSILIIQGGMHPVIDIYPEKVHDGASEYWPVYEVISHFGWVGGKEIHVPKGTSGKAHLADLLSDNVPVRVAKNKPSGYESYATSDTNYLLGTDIDGRVIWYFDMRNSRGLQQPFADDRAPSAAKTGATILLKEAARQILLRF